MKTQLLIILVMLLPALTPPQGYCQSKDTIQLQDLKVPASPGFSILDLSPTTIETPTSPKMMTLQVLNYINSNSGGFPKNFALEFAPYWMTKQQGETIYKYLGIPDAQSTNAAAGILRKLSLSFVVYSNDTSTHLLPHTSYISGGARTNLLTIWGKYAQSTVKSFLRSRNQLRQDLLRSDPLADPNTLRQRIDSAYAGNNVNVFTIKPMLVLDAAFAYSESFRNNNYQEKQFNRSAWWLNLTINTPVSRPGKDNFFIIGYFRSLRDNVLMDTVKNLFQSQHAMDLGIRAGYEAGPFQLSVEHINRNYKAGEVKDTHRTTGFIQFKMNDGFYLMGSFGRNFSQQHNLFAMLGINWGIGKNALTL